MRSAIVPDFFLMLAILSTVLVMIAAKGATGSKGRVGAWLLLVFPGLFTGALLVIFVLRQMLDWIPGGRPVQLAASLGILVSLLAGLAAATKGGTQIWSAAGKVGPYLILAGCIAVIHGGGLREPRIGAAVAAALLGCSAVAGWAVMGIGLVRYMQAGLAASAAQKDEREAVEIAECRACAVSNSVYEAASYDAFRALPADASLAQLLPYIWTRNRVAAMECQARIASRPGLDDQLIKLLDAKSNDAISYVSLQYGAPPARLAPAWARMLERELKSNSGLVHDEHAGTRELDLWPYFAGAEKIQKAGGDLRPQLRAWHEVLKNCKGLGGLAAYVLSLITGVSTARSQDFRW